MSEYLVIENLKTGYNGKPILHDISFSVGKGEVLAVIGQNGCGKSTLLKTIARIIQDNSGCITFNGMKIDHLQSWDLKRAGLSYFVQSGMVFPTMKVSEHFELGLKDKSKVEAAGIKDECLSYFPILSDCLEKRGGNLSGGQRQMLSFAMLLAQQTDCWLLDEPTAGLAPAAVNDAVGFLKKMKREKNKTMILVEHNYQAAFEVADRVMVIRDSKILASFEREIFQMQGFLEKNLFN